MQNSISTLQLKNYIGLRRRNSIILLDYGAVIYTCPMTDMIQDDLDITKDYPRMYKIQHSAAFGPYVYINLYIAPDLLG